MSLLLLLLFCFVLFWCCGIFCIFPFYAVHLHEQTKAHKFCMLLAKNYLPNQQLLQLHVKIVDCWFPILAGQQSQLPGRSVGRLVVRLLCRMVILSQRSCDSGAVSVLWKLCLYVFFLFLLLLFYLYQTIAIYWHQSCYWQKNNIK